VGTFSLSIPDQPLYQLARVQEPDSHNGPVIIINTYVPSAKYPLGKNPPEKDIQKICDEIASNLLALLKKNGTVFSH